MDIDVVGKHMVTAGQDRLLRSVPSVIVIPPQVRITSLSLSLCVCASSLCFTHRVYQLSSGKQKAVIKASTGDEGSLIKVSP